MGNENSSSTAVYSGRIASFGQEHGLHAAGLYGAKKTGKKATGAKKSTKQASWSKSTTNLKSAIDEDSTKSTNTNSSDLASSSVETNNRRKVSGSGIAGQFIKNQHQHLVQGSKLRRFSLLQPVQSSQSVDSGCSSSTTSSAAQLEGVACLLSPQSDITMLVNNQWLQPVGGPHRKHSFSEVKELEMNGRLGAGNHSTTNTLVVGKAGDRRRSRSLCAHQLKADCQAVAAASTNLNQQPASGVTMNTKKSSTALASANLLMPSLARIRIQQCFKNAKPFVGHHILKRACSLRSEIKVFLSYLTEDRVEELATDIYVFVIECVASLEEPDRVAALSRAFGQMHAQLCQMGFRPEFFSSIADAIIAECVRLDGGAHKRCETLLAWSQLMQFVFSNVRDGYYAEIRQQRRSSLPQHNRLILSKQQSIDVRNNYSLDMDL